MELEPQNPPPIGEVFAGLDALVLAVSANAVGTYGREWVGADVAFVDHEDERFAVHGWSPCLQVPSPHYLALGWLVRQLRELMGAWLDYANKYEYYGRLGRAVNEFTTLYGREVPQEAVLLACLHEAYALADQFSQEGALPTLAITLAGEIPDDAAGLAGNLRPERAENVRRALEESGYPI